MRTIKYIVVHCTATQQNATVESIKKYWREVKGWEMPGYHFIIKPNGDHEQLADESRVCNGVKGYNEVSIHVSYIGGVDKNGKALDNRTSHQKNKMTAILRMLKGKYPNAVIQGHRDFPNVHKDCPSFDAKEYYKNLI